MNPQEIQDFKDKIENDTLDKVIKKVSVNDSYFYAEMVVIHHLDVMDPFAGAKIKCVVKMNLFNSKNFIGENTTNSKPTMQKAKQIISEIVLDSEDLIRSKEDAMLLVYKLVGEEIAASLFQENARKIFMSIHNTQDGGRRYI